jgi:hypothetical protein
LALEETVRQLNHGKVPAFFLTGADAETRARMMEIVATRRFTLMALTERKDSEGNSMAWIKIEPANILPYPLSAMRGMGWKKHQGFPVLPGALVREFFED